MARLTPDFERLLRTCIAQGEEDGVALVIAEAARRDDADLSRFLDALAARLELHQAPLRAEEIRALLRHPPGPAARY